MKHTYLLPLLLLALPASGPAILRPAAPSGRVAEPTAGSLAGRSRGGIPADTSRGALASVMADVRHRSLFLSTDAKTGTLTAGNYAQHLAATFGPTSYTVAAPTQGGAAPAWQVRFALRGIGRAGAPGLALAAGPAEPATHEEHTSYPHPAFAVDYDNTPAGVRQTFRLAERPAGTGPVAVRLHLATALHAQPAGSGALVFTDGRRRAPVLRYDSLQAWDATGRVLPAHLRLDGPTALALVVDDADATYPVTIDPLASTAGTTLTGQNAGDTFATSVALVGDLNGDGYGELAVGAPAFSAGAGCVYIYRGSSTGLVPTATTQLLGSGTDNYGTSVAGAGDFNGDGYADLLVGAPGYSGGRGVAYIYGGGTTFFTNPLANAAGTAGFTNARGGTSVAGAGDVNGDGYDDYAFGGPAFNSDAGSVSIVFGNAGLSAATSTALTGGAAGYRLGVSLTGLGDTNGDGYADLAVGAPGVSSALVVRGANSTLFSGFSAFYLTPTGGSTAGTSVAGPGDVNGDGLADVLLGAPGAGTSGSVYLFVGSAGLSGTSVQDAVFSTTTPGESFGTAVAGAGDINGDGYADFVVGAPAYAANKGRVYVSLGRAVLANISNTPQIIDGATAGDRFGSSVSGGDANCDGYGDVLVGAPAYSSSTGRAYAYYGSPAALLASSSLSLANPNNAVNDNFGISVASAGDVNGDGYGDVIIGAYGTSSLRGSAYLYLGSATGLGTAAGTTAGTYQRLDSPNNAANDYFGWSVAGAGDVNGDGYADVLIGAYGTSNRGSAYLYLGSATGLGTTAGTTAGTYQRRDEPGIGGFNFFGYSVAGAGDVNGDGYADVVIGAYGAGTGGSSYLYLGSATGLGTTAGTTAGTYQRRDDPNSASGDNFGRSVAGAGDVNGDGFADVLVGAYGTDNAGTNRGSTYLYLGSATGLGTAAGTAAGTYQRLNNPANVDNDSFGWSVAGAGDVNGDGYADALIGAFGPGAGGSAYLCLGSATGLGTTAGSTAGTNQRLDNPNSTSGDNFGRSGAGTGDVNGDGYADVLIGAEGTDNGGANRGSAYLCLGSATGLGTTAGTTAGTYQRLDDPANVDSDNFGISGAGAGDVNGDGYGDIIIGAYGTSGNRGSAYLYRGNQGEARAGGLRLYNTDLSSPISASNRPNTQFGIGLTARNPAGRIRARLVWEVVRPATSFSNPTSLPTSTAYSGRGAWTALPASGTAPELKALVAKTGRASRVRARLEYASSPLPATTPPNGVGGPASRVRYGPWTYVAAQQLGQSSSAATPLPVELTYFTATAEDSRAVRLAWATASEKNSLAFEVERSTNGETFARITTVAAAGSSSAPRHYELLDARLPNGATMLYYRLRQVDLDGTFSYSPVRAVAGSGKPTAGLLLFPNPTSGAATLTGAEPGTAVMVFDALGRKVTSATADATGTAGLVLPAGLPTGVYVVRTGNKALRLTVE